MPRITTSVAVATPYTEVRPLYERADGLDSLTPSMIGLEVSPIEGPLDPLDTGSRFRVSARLFGVGPAAEGVVEITDIDFGEEGGYVEDTVIDGPFESWRHRRTLEAIPDGTRIIDDLRYHGPPGGSIGRLGAPVVLNLMFGYRSRSLRRRFGSIR